MSPPQAEFGGRPHPTILAAAALLGVDEVWAAGAPRPSRCSRTAASTPTAPRWSPWTWSPVPATSTSPPPSALLRGRIGIDSEAGTTEIAILADHTANPVHVAADLISQAEHDPAAASVLVTTSPELADAVDAEVASQVATTKHTERITTALSGPQSGTILVSSVADGLRVVDAYAAEHLEIQTADAREVAARVRNAGAVFVGPHSPVSLGDYCAGSNHVLPTGGYARHSSGLYGADLPARHPRRRLLGRGPRRCRGHIVALADAEDLPAHGQAITAR